MKRPSFSRSILPVIAISGIIGSFIYIASSQPETSLSNPKETPARTPEEQSRTGSIVGTGVIEPSSETVDVATHVPGIVAKVFVFPGDQVGVGQPLFEIDSRNARAAVDEAIARAATARQNIVAAQTSLRVAQNQYALYQKVDDVRAVSQQEVITRRDAVADARAQLAVAQAQARQANAQVAQANVELDRHVVRAPAGMEVLQVDTRAGEYAGTQGTASVLMRLGATKPLHVRLDIDENQIEKISLGQPAVISARGDAKRRVKATFVRAEPLIVPKRSLTNSATERVDVRVLQLIFALPPESGQFFVGQQVDGFVPAKARP
ncbi:MAG: HlyD family secretion protein [Sphingorhabdus sp.]